MANVYYPADVSAAAGAGACRLGTLRDAAGARDVLRGRPRAIRSGPLKDVPRPLGGGCAAEVGGGTLSGRPVLAREGRGPGPERLACRGSREPRLRGDRD